MYIFVYYVPAAGRIASATARNRAGPLPMQAPSEGGRARACVVVPLFPATPLQSRQIEVVTACQFHYQSNPPS